MIKLLNLIMPTCDML